jgi:hypothetical protein
MSMDVNPISLQMVVPRATDAGQVQHNLNQQPNMQQQFAMEREQMDVKTRMETVQTRDNAEDGRIKDDPERQSRGGGYSGNQGKRRDRGNEEEDQPVVDLLRGHNIDISL